jgi:hypothetical protein
VQSEDDAQAPPTNPAFGAETQLILNNNNKNNNNNNNKTIDSKIIIKHPAVRPLF